MTDPTTMPTMPTHYTFPLSLVQAIVSQLNSMPAGQVRPLLNALEAECVAQDQRHTQPQDWPQIDPAPQVAA